MPGASRALVGRFKYLADEHFVHHDGPIAGYAESDTGERFALNLFEVLSILGREKSLAGRLRATSILERA